MRFDLWNLLVLSRPGDRETSQTDICLRSLISSDFASSLRILYRQNLPIQSPGPAKSAGRDRRNLPGNALGNALTTPEAFPYQSARPRQGELTMLGDVARNALPEKKPAKAQGPSEQDSEATNQGTDTETRSAGER